MQAASKWSARRVGFGVVILAGVVGVAGCGGGKLDSQMPEQKMGTKGAGAPGMSAPSAGAPSAAGGKVDPNAMRMRGIQSRPGAGSAPSTP